LKNYIAKVDILVIIIITDKYAKQENHSSILNFDFIWCPCICWSLLEDAALHILCEVDLSLMMALAFPVSYVLYLVLDVIIRIADKLTSTCI